VKALYFKDTYRRSTTDIPNGQPFGIILDRTNFYAESGGQEADTGRIVIDGKTEIEVTDVQVYSGYVMHIGVLQGGTLSVDDDVVCTYDDVSYLSPNIVIENEGHPNRQGGDLYKAITLPLIFLTSVFARFWATT